MRLLLVLSLAVVLWSLSLSPTDAKRVRVKTAIIPKGPKKPSLVTESVASDLPYPLGHLWVYLARVDMPWLLCRNWQIMGVLGVPFIILGICRNVREPSSQARNQEQTHREGQASNQEQSHRKRQAQQSVQGREQAASQSMRTDRRAKRTINHAQFYKMMRAETMLLLRTTRSVHRLYLQQLRHEYYQRKAAERFQKSRTFPRSPGPSSS